MFRMLLWVLTQRVAKAINPELQRRYTLMGRMPVAKKATKKNRKVARKLAAKPVTATPRNRKVAQQKAPSIETQIEQQSHAFPKA